MRLLAFAIYDEKADAYMSPFFAAAPGIAIRNFMDIFKSPDNWMQKHPTDFKLFRIGNWDDNTGELSAEKPVLMANGNDGVQLEVAK
jgi:hypothetical protein